MYKDPVMNQQVKSNVTRSVGRKRGLAAKGFELIWFKASQGSCGHALNSSTDQQNRMNVKTDEISYIYPGLPNPEKT